MSTGTGKARAKDRKILYIQYTNPAHYPPLEHSSRILVNSGWQVVFLGIHVPGDRIEFSPHANIRVRRLTLCRDGWLQKLRYAIFCIWVCAWVLAWRPRWVYASDPLSCGPALLLSWISGVRLVYHEHDSPEPASERDGRFRRLVHWTRARLAARAEFCILPNRRRVELFASEFPLARQVLCIWNCASHEEVAPARSGSHECDFWLLYQGSLAPTRLPATVLHAMRELPPQVKLCVVGYETLGHPTFLKEFTDTAARLGLQDRLEIVGTLPLRSNMLESSFKCHVGLSLMPARGSNMNERTMSGASNKPFDYMACGLAVLVSDLPDWKAMFVDPGYGLSCVPEEPESIARALRWLYDHRDDTKAMGERGRSRIAAEWNYETQFAPVLRLLQEPDRGASLPIREIGSRVAD